MTMKLSEALRLGAMALPPSHGPVYARANGAICGACAVGAALFAVGSEADREQWLKVGASIQREMARFWPWTGDFTTPKPVEPSYDINVVTAMVVLFENSDWTREQIADWIATIEPTDSVEEVPAHVHSTEEHVSC